MSFQTDNIEVSVIIVSYNSSNTIHYCLNSLFKFSPISFFEVILIDNYSTDSSVEIIKSLPFDLKLIQNNSNIGFARACNQGIKQAKGKYIFLLNPDTKLLNDAFSIFINFMKKKENEEVWCVGAKLFDKSGAPSKSYGRFPNLVDVISEQIGVKGLLLKLFGNNYLKKRNLIKEQKIIPFVMGCNMFIRKSDLEKIGLFDEQFFLNFEETELSWRAEKLGYKSMILPEAKILHYSGKSFTDLQSYLNHLWLGQLLFFKLTHNRSIFLFVKLIHLTGALLRFTFKFDKNYLINAKKILSV